MLMLFHNKLTYWCWLLLFFPTKSINQEHIVLVSPLPSVCHTVRFCPSDCLFVRLVASLHLSIPVLHNTILLLYYTALALLFPLLLITVVVVFNCCSSFQDLKEYTYLNNRLCIFYRPYIRYRWYFDMSQNLFPRLFGGGHGQCTLSSQDRFDTPY